MGRNLSNTADYFPHMAKSGKTLAILEGRWQAAGYTFWFKLLETLTSTENHFINCEDPSTWEYLLASTYLDEKTAVEILDVLSRLGNIDCELWTENKIIWCQNLVNNLSELYRNRRRELPKKPISTPNNAITTSKKGISTPKNGITTCRNNKKITTPKKAISTCNNPHRRVEKSREDVETVVSTENQEKDAIAPADAGIDDDSFPSADGDADLLLYHATEKAFLSKNDDRFTDYGKEGAAIKNLIKKATSRAPENAEAFLAQMIAEFWKQKENGNAFWKGQPFLPSALNASSIWDRVLETLRVEQADPTSMAIARGERI
jgi:hypothetical protein